MHLLFILHLLRLLHPPLPPAISIPPAPPPIHATPVPFTPSTSQFFTLTAPLYIISFYPISLHIHLVPGPTPPTSCNLLPPRSDCVKSCDLHPTEQWMLLYLCNRYAITRVSSSSSCSRYLTSCSCFFSFSSCCFFCSCCSYSCFLCYFFFWPNSSTPQDCDLPVRASVVVPRLNLVFTG